MGEYENFAEVYDHLMCDVNYEKRAKYLLSLFEKYDRRPKVMLDLACGTGAFSNEFAKCGIEVIGADASPEMLCTARCNSDNLGLNVFYLCQRAEDLDLYGTVDGAVCCLDSLNHITDYGSFCRAISRVSLFLEPERLFIFDVNTVYKHKYILADNTYITEEDGVYCVWQNQTDENTLITDIMLDFFIKDGETYRRTCEDFSERAYTKEEIKSALCAAGLKIETVLDDISGKPVNSKTERAVYVTRKVKGNK